MLKINESYRSLIPALTEEEFKQLEKNCLENGIREPLVVSDGTLLDGHNRYEIAQKNGLEYETIQYYFDTEYDRVNWIINNQLGRRNVTEEQKAYLRGKRYENEKQNWGGHLRKDEEDKMSSSNTSEKLAKEYNVSDKTIKRDAEFALGVDKTAPQLKKEILEGKSKLNKSDIQEIAKAEPFFVATTAEEVERKAKEIRNEKKEKILNKRKELHETLSKQILKVSEKKYRIVYADPPWKYSNAMPEYVTEPQDYYLLMDTIEICKMPVKEITDENAVLFLWSTSPHLPEAFEVLNSWGFTYKTTFIWDKIKHNMGHYNSVRHEILIVATKGSCTPDVKKLFDSVLSIERTEHSKKPEEFRNIIETLYTYGNKIELFSRNKIDGWDVFGNQINN